MSTLEELLEQVRPLLPWDYKRDDGQFIVDAKGNIVAEVPCQGVNPEYGVLIVAAVNGLNRLVREPQHAQTLTERIVCEAMDAAWSPGAREYDRTIIAEKLNAALASMLPVTEGRKEGQDDILAALADAVEELLPGTGLSWDVAKNDESALAWLKRVIKRSAQEPQHTAVITGKMIQEATNDYWGGIPINHANADEIAKRLNAALASTPQPAIEQLECEMCDRPITNRTYICSDCWNKAVASAKPGDGR